MTKLFSVGSTSNTPNKTYIVDTTAEMNALEKEFGTFVINLQDANAYICNGSGEWVLITK